jgi:hypothetical protein
MIAKASLQSTEALRGRADRDVGGPISEGDGPGRRDRRCGRSASACSGWNTGVAMRLVETLPDSA